MTYKVLIDLLKSIESLEEIKPQLHIPTMYEISHDNSVFQIGENCSIYFFESYKDDYYIILADKESAFATHSFWTEDYVFYSGFMRSLLGSDNDVSSTGK